MSELPHGPVDSETKLADIISIRQKEQPETLSPSELSSDELIAAFFSQYSRHPAMKGRDPREIAERIRREIDADLKDKDIDQMSTREQKWRSAYLALSIDAMDITVEQSDELESQDEIYGIISSMRRNTRSNAKEFGPQRRALAALQNFRLGIVTRDIETADADWLSLIDLLFPAQRQP